MDITTIPTPACIAELLADDISRVGNHRKQLELMYLQEGTWHHRLAKRNQALLNEEAANDAANGKKRKKEKGQQREEDAGGGGGGCDDEEGKHQGEQAAICSFANANLCIVKEGMQVRCPAPSLHLSYYMLKSYYVTGAGTRQV